MDAHPLSTLALQIGLFVLGAAGWSVTEYVLHRWVGHGPRQARPRGLRRFTPRGFLETFNVEHLDHHADPQTFAPTSHKAAASAVVIGGLVAIFAALGILATGVPFALGFGLTYLTYEILHRRIHTHAPRNAYGRWMRRHHLAHHHLAPKLNHGVTTPLWDLVFGTWQRLGPATALRVPRRAATPWMVDAEGALRAEYAGAYELAGRDTSPA